MASLTVELAQVYGGRYVLHPPSQSQRLGSDKRKPNRGGGVD